MKNKDKKVYRCKFGEKIGCCQVECRHPQYIVKRKQYGIDYCETCDLFDEKDK